MPEDRLRQLVAERTEGRTFGLLGEPRVNVLELNLALDESEKSRPASLGAGLGGGLRSDGRATSRP